jgi:hypothetical protein
MAIDKTQIERAVKPLTELLAGYDKKIKEARTKLEEAQMRIPANIGRCKTLSVICLSSLRPYPSGRDLEGGDS